MHKHSKVISSADEREALLNDLDGLVESYKAGWDSEGEIDSDD